VFDLQGFFIFCVSKKCRFFPLSTTISDTKLTHGMTHRSSVFQPAHLVGNSTKKAIKKGYLTHSLTHELTHSFGSQCSLKMSVVTSIPRIAKKKNFIHFSTLFFAAKNVCQNQAHKVTGMNGMACSLNSYFFTAKTTTL
jgi:hypothetical protein